MYFMHPIHSSHNGCTEDCMEKPTYEELERALRVSEARYAELIQNAQNIILRMDVKGNVTFINRFAQAFLRLREEDALGKPVVGTIVLPTEHAKRNVENVILDHLRQPEAFLRYELKSRLHDGRTVWISWTNKALLDENGTPGEILCVGIDITDRKRAEEVLHEAEGALRKSERDYRALVQNARSIILRLDTRGRITFFNEYAQAFFGYSESEILGKHVVGTIVPEIDSAGNDLTLMMDDILAHPEQFSQNENENMRHNGERVWISWANRTIYDERDNPLEILCVGIDVTERKRVETALRENERKFRGIVEESVDGIILLDETGRIIEWNRACESILCRSKGEVMGRFFWEVWCELSFREVDIIESRDEFEDDLRQFLSTGVTPWEEEFLQQQIVCTDGSIRHIQEVVFSIPTDKGFMLCGIIRNITSLREAEERAKLHQQQLIQADKMASLGILVSGVAHEINNPNNFIMLNAEILTRAWESITPILREYYDRNGDFSLAGIPYSKAHEKLRLLISGLHEGAERIEKIVGNLKSFTRQDSGEMSELLDIDAVMDSALLIAHNLVKKSTNCFTLSRSETLPPVRGNFQRLEQVIINLIANACQALPSRDKSIRVSIAFDSSAHRITIDIADEGVGIPPENIRRIMDPFFTTKRDSGGTGLGLSISYSIVKEHGGDLSLSSEPGKGTTARISLPACMEPQMNTDKRG